MRNHLTNIFRHSYRPFLIRTSLSILTLKTYTKESRGESAVEEKAPSTAEEFERVAKEKVREGVVSQTLEKAYDGAEEAAVGDSDVRSVKRRFEEHEEGAEYHKTGDNDGPVNTVEGP